MKNVNSVVLITFALLAGFTMWFLIISAFSWIICVSFGVPFMWKYTFGWMAIQVMLSSNRGSFKELENTLSEIDVLVTGTKQKTKKTKKKKDKDGKSGK